MKSTIFEYVRKKGLSSLLPRYLGIRIIGYQLRKGYVQYYLCTRNPRTPSKNPDCTISIVVHKTDKSKTYTFTFGGNKKLKLDRPSLKSGQFEIKRFLVLSTVLSIKHAILSD